MRAFFVSVFILPSSPRKFRWLLTGCLSQFSSRGLACRSSQCQRFGRSGGLSSRHRRGGGSRRRQYGLLQSETCSGSAAWLQPPPTPPRKKKKKSSPLSWQTRLQAYFWQVLGSRCNGEVKQATLNQYDFKLQNQHRFGLLEC